jgi:hypothetical protein
MTEHLSPTDQIEASLKILIRAAYALLDRTRKDPIAQTGEWLDLSHAQMDASSLLANIRSARQQVHLLHDSADM